MNPLTNMKNVIKLSEQELHSSNKTTWHDQYRDSAWVFVGGLPFDLTEGDIICIFSQYGEIVNINLIRDKDNGKSRGFCFICYEDQRSTDLAVDNFNGIKILNRIIRVDHVNNYKVPKTGKKTDEETKKLYNEGCAPVAAPVKPALPVEVKKEDVRETLADWVRPEIKLPERLPIYNVKKEKVSDDEGKKEKKHKKGKKHKKKKKKKSSSESDDDEVKNKRKKRERSRSREQNTGYSKRRSRSRDRSSKR